MRKTYVYFLLTGMVFNTSVSFADGQFYFSSSPTSPAINISSENLNKSDSKLAQLKNTPEQKVFRLEEKVEKPARKKIAEDTVDTTSSKFEPDTEESSSYIDLKREDMAILRSTLDQSKDINTYDLVDNDTRQKANAFVSEFGDYTDDTKSPLALPSVIKTQDEAHRVYRAVLAAKKITQGLNDAGKITDMSDLQNTLTNLENRIMTIPEYKIYIEGLLTQQDDESPEIAQQPAPESDVPIRVVSVKTKLPDDLKARLKAMILPKLPSNGLRKSNLDWMLSVDVTEKVGPLQQEVYRGFLAATLGVALDLNTDMNADLKAGFNFLFKDLRHPKYVRELAFDAMGYRDEYVNMYKGKDRETVIDQGLDQVRASMNYLLSAYYPSDDDVYPDAASISELMDDFFTEQLANPKPQWKMAFENVKKYMNEVTPVIDIDTSSTPEIGETVSSDSSHDTEIGEAVSTDIPSPEIGTAVSTDIPSTEIGTAVSTDIPSPEIGTAVSKTFSKKEIKKAKKKARKAEKRKKRKERRRNRSG